MHFLRGTRSYHPQHGCHLTAISPRNECPMPKVMIGPAPLARLDGDFLTVLVGAGFELVYPGRGAQLTEEQLLQDVRGVEASLAGSEPYTRRVLEAAKGLRVIARAGVGIDAVDVPAATERA